MRSIIFFYLPKLGNALQDLVGVEVRVQKDFNFTNFQDFSKFWSRPWHIFRKKKKKRTWMYITHLFLWSIHCCKLKPIYILKKTQNSSTSPISFFSISGSRHQKLADYQRGNKVDKATEWNSYLIGFVAGRIKLPYLTEDNKSSFLFFLK